MEWQRRCRKGNFVTKVCLAIVVVACVLYFFVSADSKESTGSGSPLRLQTSRNLLSDVSSLAKLHPSNLERIVHSALSRTDSNSASYVAVSCVGRNQDSPVLQYCEGDACDKLSKVSRLCKGVSATRLHECQTDAVRNTPQQARLTNIGVYRMDNGKFMGAHAKSNDVVSNDVMRTGRFVTEVAESTFLVRASKALREEVRSAARLLLERHGVSDAEASALIQDAGWDDGVEMFDFGMNLGSLSIPVWAANFAVYGVEGMTTNQQLLRMTQCMNRDDTGATPPFDFQPFALTNSENVNATCVFVSTDGNVGDGIVQCGNIEDAITRGYKIRGNLTFRLLDVVFAEPTTCGSLLYRLIEKRIASVASDPGKVWSKAFSSSRQRGKAFTFPSQRLSAASTDAEILSFLCARHRVLKIDVEGHEIHVWEGGAKFLASPNAPVVILSEIWKLIDGVKYASLMRSHGYRMYVPKFGWADDDAAAARFREWQPSLVNVFFVKRGAEALVPKW